MELKVYTHDGKVMLTNVETYSPADIAEQMADNSTSYLAVGDLVLAKHSVYRIIPSASEQE